MAFSGIVFAIALGNVFGVMRLSTDFFDHIATLKLDGFLCLDTLRRALSKGRPRICNTHQGAQFTADAIAAGLLAANIQVSKDGRGRALDNIFCERLWRSVKYENIYLNQYDSVHQLQTGLDDYFVFYNNERPHQNLNYRTPAERHYAL